MQDAVADELGLELQHLLTGGEHGAWAVCDATGTRLVLKVFPRDEHPRLTEAIALANRLRSRGIPVPNTYRAGATASAAYTLQTWCDGGVPPLFLDTHARQLLELWQLQLDAAPALGPWPSDVRRALTVGAPDFFADHTPLRDAGGPVAALLDEIVAVGHGGDIGALRAGDVVHGDWHHQNLLVTDDRVTTVFDWESARAGDARLDLVYLNFWADVFEGIEFEPAAVERIRAAVDTYVEPAARRLLSALIALQQLWFIAAHRAHRIDEVIEWTDRHLAPVWRA